jgi:hypothetical protein
MQACCSILSYVADKTKHARKSTRAKTMLLDSPVSCSRLMRQACWSLTLSSHLVFFHRGRYNNNSPGTFLLNLVLRDNFS